MIFKDKSPLYAVELERKQGEEVLYINFLGANKIPSIADDPGIMAIISSSESRRIYHKCR